MSEATPSRKAENEKVHRLLPLKRTPVCIVRVRETSGGQIETKDFPVPSSISQY